MHETQADINNKWGAPTVLSAILVHTVLVHVQDESAIDDARLDRLEQVEEEDACGDRRVLERANGPQGWLGLLSRHVGPLEHLCVADRTALASRLGERSQRLGDAHSLPGFKLAKEKKCRHWLAHLISCHTRPSMSVLFPSTISAPWMQPDACHSACRGRRRSSCSRLP